MVLDSQVKRINYTCSGVLFYLRFAGHILYLIDTLCKPYVRAMLSAPGWIPSFHSLLMMYRHHEADVCRRHQVVSSKAGPFFALKRQ